MSASGRPLRFVGATLAGWVAVRLVWLWPEVVSPADALPPVLGESLRPMTAAPRAVGRPVMGSSVRVAILQNERRGAPFRSPSRPMLAAVAPTLAVPEQETAEHIARGSPEDSPMQSPPLRLPSLAVALSRWALSVWGIARDGRDDALATGQLGGSQVGARATYVIDRARRIALAARLSAPIAGRGREGAIGIDWQPTPAPVHVIAEQRAPLDGGPSRPAAYVAGGIDPLAIGGGFRLEAYGQAGGVHRRGGFADGAVRVAAAVANVGGLRLDLGIGAWGGAQRRAARVDIGPTVALTVPVGGRAVRLTLDWRQRVAGAARPGSGPALSIGGDF